MGWRWVTAGSASPLLGTRSGKTGGRGAGTTKKLKAGLGSWKGGGVVHHSATSPLSGEGSPPGLYLGGGGGWICGGSTEARTRTVDQLLVSLSPLSRFWNTWLPSAYQARLDIHHRFPLCSVNQGSFYCLQFCPLRLFLRFRKTSVVAIINGFISVAKAGLLTT